MVEQGLEQHAGPERVHRGVLGGLVHALADSDPGREMDDGVDPVDRAADDVGVAHVAGNQLDVSVQIVGPLGAVVHLLDEAVEHAHAVSGSDELVGEVRADEAGSAGDEDALGQGRNVTRQARRILGSTQA